MTQTIPSLLRELSELPSQQSQDTPDDRWIASASPEQLTALLQGLLDLAQRQAILNRPRLDSVLMQVVYRLRQTHDAHHPATAGAEPSRRQIILLYKHLGTENECRWRLLQALAAAADPESLRALVQWLPTATFPDDNAVALVFSPLFQQRTYRPSDIFPALLEALDRPQLAPSILDLANFLVRDNRSSKHPAADRRNQLEELLRGLVYRLQKLEETDGGANSPHELSRTVADAVALVVSLCDALALIGDSDSIAILSQAMDLPHRRIRTEAAAALARLGDEKGMAALLDLAREPVARLRVLAYAAELGLEDRLDPQYATDEARCEAEVALQLAQPAYFGLPPTRIEKVDHREMFWPGCDQPVTCYLFRYYYELGASKLSNIAIGGPLVHTFAADLVDLPVDDIYAAFAGWDLEHAEAFEVPVDELNDAQRPEVSRLERRARDAGYEDVAPDRLGNFFGARFLVAAARRGSVKGTLAVDHDQILWYPASGLRPLGVHEVLCIYKGRQLLRSFDG